MVFELYVYFLVFELHEDRCTVRAYIDSFVLLKFGCFVSDACDAGDAESLQNAKWTFQVFKIWITQRWNDLRKTSVAYWWDGDIALFLFPCLVDQWVKFWIWMDRKKKRTECWKVSISFCHNGDGSSQPWANECHLGWLWRLSLKVTISINIYQHV